VGVVLGWLAIQDAVEALDTLVVKSRLRSKTDLMKDRTPKP
jgi:hypothetical protein